MDKMYKETLDMLKLAIKLSEDYNMTNELIFLDFLDAVNKLSVKY